MCLEKWDFLQVGYFKVKNMWVISARVTDSICLKRKNSVIIWQSTVNRNDRMSSNGIWKEKLQETERDARDQLTG